MSDETRNRAPSSPHSNFDRARVRNREALSHDPQALMTAPELGELAAAAAERLTAVRDAVASRS